jgi:hypothetical protein
MVAELFDLGYRSFRGFELVKVMSLRWKAEHLTGAATGQPHELPQLHRF